MTKGLGPRPGQPSQQGRAAGQNKEIDKIPLHPSAPTAQHRQPLSQSPAGLPAIIHRLSQPLTALHGSLELALLTPHGAAEYRSALQEALTQARSLLGMLASLRDLVDAEDPGESSEVTGLKALVEDAVGELRALAETRGVKISFDSKGAVFVRADSARLRMAVYKVIRHAIARSPERGAMRVVLATEDRLAWFVVVDEGCTLSAGELDHLTRALTLGALFSEASKRDTLEWAVAKRIFETQGGTVQVQCRPGAGCSFRASWTVQPSSPV